MMAGAEKGVNTNVLPETGRSAIKTIRRLHRLLRFLSLICGYWKWKYPTTNRSRQRRL